MNLNRGYNYFKIKTVLHQLMKYPVYQKQKFVSWRFKTQIQELKVCQSRKRDSDAAPVFYRRSDDFWN